VGLSAWLIWFVWVFRRIGDQILFWLHLSNRVIGFIIDLVCVIEEYGVDLQFKTGASQRKQILNSY